MTKINFKSVLVFILFCVHYSVLFAQSNFWERAGLDTKWVIELATDQKGILYAGGWPPWETFYRSTDDGNSWTFINGITLPFVFSYAFNDSFHIFASGGGCEGRWCYGGIFRSTNNGVSWVQILDSDTTYFGDMIINSSGHIIVETGGVSGGEPHGRLLISVDNGTSWKDFFKPDSGIIDDLIINSAGYIFAGTGIDWPSERAHVYRSTDNGTNWTRVLVVDSSSVDGLASNQSGHVFAGTIKGVFRSTDNGDTWTLSNAGLTNNSITALATDANGHVYAGNWLGGGVFRSTDNGDHWTAINSGLTNTFVYALAINAAGCIFAGTESGVFRSVHSTTSILTPSAEQITGYKLESNYPNPFNPTTTIKYSIPSSEYITIKTYDILGREVATLVDEYRPAGSYEVDFDATGLQSGVYFYQICAGTFVKTNKMILMK